MIDCELLASFTRPNPPANLEALLRAQQQIKLTFPVEYINLLRCSNGFFVPNVASLLLYSVDELLERNETYEVQEYLPGWIMIGDDGGGQGIFIHHRDTNAQPFINGMGSMLITDAQSLAGSLSQWISKCCSIT
jgi:hypothetical protein